MFRVCSATPGCYETKFRKGKCGDEINSIRKIVVVEQCEVRQIQVNASCRLGSKFPNI